MTREEVISRIKTRETEVRATGVSALYLFGSTARGEAGPASDIDLLCDIDPARRMGLFEFLGIQQNLEEILGNPVDLVEQKALLPTIANHVRRDMVRIF